MIGHRNFHKEECDGLSTLWPLFSLSPLSHQKVKAGVSPETLENLRCERTNPGKIFASPANGTNPGK